MSKKLHPGETIRPDLITGIAPIFRVDPSTHEPHLIGTGFWITEFGHLVSAWHVVDENIDANSIDKGPIFAVQTRRDRSVTIRHFARTDRHPKFDLAVTQTVPGNPHQVWKTEPLTFSLDEVKVEEPVFSFAVLHQSQTFATERWPGATTAQFSGEAYIDPPSAIVPLEYAVRQSHGYVSEIFREARDRVMLPFPCIQTDVPIYGANSGGPLFDRFGRVCAVHCTSYEGSDIAFHVPIQGLLPIRTDIASLNLPPEVGRTTMALGELAILGLVRSNPPMLDGSRFIRSLLRWCWHSVGCLRRGRGLPDFHFGVVEKR